MPASSKDMAVAGSSRPLTPEMAESRPPTSDKQVYNIRYQLNTLAHYYNCYWDWNGGGGGVAVRYISDQHLGTVRCGAFYDSDNGYRYRCSIINNNNRRLQKKSYIILYYDNVYGILFFSDMPTFF